MASQEYSTTVYSHVLVFLATCAATIGILSLGLRHKDGPSHYDSLVRVLSWGITFFLGHYRRCHMEEIAAYLGVPPLVPVEKMCQISQVLPECKLVALLSWCLAHEKTTTFGGFALAMPYLTYLDYKKAMEEREKNVDEEAEAAEGPSRCEKAGVASLVE